MLLGCVFVSAIGGCFRRLLNIAVAVATLWLWAALLFSNSMLVPVYLLCMLNENLSI